MKIQWYSLDRTCNQKWIHLRLSVSRLLTILAVPGRPYNLYQFLQQYLVSRKPFLFLQAIIGQNWNCNCSVRNKLCVLRFFPTYPHAKETNGVVDNNTNHRLDIFGRGLWWTFSVVLLPTKTNWNFIKHQIQSQPCGTTNGNSTRQKNQRRESTQPNTDGDISYNNMRRGRVVRQWCSAFTVCTG